MPSGWTRWLLEQFEFPFQVVYPPELDKGDLREKFDVLILVDGAYPARGGPDGGRAGGGDQRRRTRGDAANERPASETDPYRGRRGSLTATHDRAATEEVPRRRRHDPHHRQLDAPRPAARPAGGESPGRDGRGWQGAAAPAGEVLRARRRSCGSRVDPRNPLAWGLGDEVDVMFSASPTFRLTDGDEAKDLRRVAWFDGKTPLRSGWAWGQEHLDGGIAIIDARVGKGRLVLFGPQVLFRGQPHGTFKFVFNGIVQSVVEEKPADAANVD